MGIYELIITGAIPTLIWISGWWLFSLYIKDSSVISVAWGAGIALIAWCLIIADDEILGSQLVASILALIWGLRLSLHILWRKRNKNEDWRYKKIRDNNKQDFWWKSYFIIFLPQGILMNLVAMPFFVMAYSPTYARPSLIISGGLVWLVGWLFETVGDWQLERFLKTSKKGQIMDKGLWRYIRHPNYFGEITVWWGIWIISMTVSLGWLAVISPLTICYLLLKISGLNLLEDKYKTNKKYQEYSKKTSVLIPLPPRK